MKKDNIFSKIGIPSKKAKTQYFTGPVSAKDISAIIKPNNEKIYHVTFKNDCVHIPAMMLHTHGSVSKKINFSHIAINTFPKRKIEPKTVWYESDFNNKADNILA